jgi:zinc/manganese transport system ATP-binding protein
VPEGRSRATAQNKNETQSYDTFGRVNRTEPRLQRSGAGPERPGPAFELCDAAVRLGGRTVWSEVSVAMERGEFVALLGANGSGKSTLLRVLLGALPLARGTAQVLGGPPGSSGASIGYLPQRHTFDRGMRLRGEDMVRLGLDGDRFGLPLPGWGAAAAGRRRARARVKEAIAMVGADAYAGRAIGECSGGEQQRLLIAQALVRRPELLLLDEPLDGLDLPNQASAAGLVAGICRSGGVGVLLVAHDVNPLLPYVDRVIYLAGGRAVQGPVGEVITSETLSGLFGMPIEVLRASDGRLVVVGAPDQPAHHHDRHDHTGPARGAGEMTAHEDSGDGR